MPPGDRAAGAGEARHAGLAVLACAAVGAAAALAGGPVGHLALRALVVAVWIALVAASLARWHRLFDVPRQFLPQYLGLAAAALAGLVLRGDVVWSAGAAVALATTAESLMAWWPLPGRTHGGAGVAAGSPLRLFYANVLTESRSASRLAPLIAEADADLVALVEVDEDWLRSLDLESMGYRHHVAVPREDHFGIALFARRPLRDGRIVPLPVPEMPALAATLEVGRGRLEVLVVHTMPPKGPRRSALGEHQTRVAAAHAAAAAAPFLLVGDLNAAPWSAAMARLRNRGRLADVRLGRGFLPTWPARLPWGLRLPIDHVLVKGDVRARAIRLGPPFGSDHRPLVADLVVGAGAGSDSGAHRPPEQSPRRPKKAR